MTTRIDITDAGPALSAAVHLYGSSALDLCCRITPDAGRLYFHTERPIETLSRGERALWDTLVGLVHGTESPAWHNLEMFLDARSFQAIKHAAGMFGAHGPECAVTRWQSLPTFGLADPTCTCGALRNRTPEVTR